MYRRIISITSAVIFLFVCAVGRIGFIIFSGNYTVSSGYNSYTLDFDVVRQTIYDRNMSKITNGEKTLCALIRPNEKCLSELHLLFNQEECNDIREELSKGYPVIRETENYADCEYIQLFETVKNKTSPLIKYIQKEYGDIISEKKINFGTDAKGRLLDADMGTVSEYDYENKISGVKLTIDDDIQKTVEEATKNLKKGAVVVMDVNTSEILAIHSTPDDNMYRAVLPYTVGSVFKLIVSSCALENGINPQYECTGSITIGDTEFSCQNDKVHGKETIKEALANSCNCYFVNLALNIGSEKLLKTAQQFGFGSSFSIMENTVVDSGNLPTAEELQSKGQLSLLGFGQGKLTASPLAFCTALCTIANGGFYTKPTLILGLLDDNNNLNEFDKKESKKIITAETSKTLCEYMRYVVTNGTAASAEYKGKSAGKTSTAQSGQYDGEREILNTWFAGVYPYDNPKYAIVVMAEDGSSGSSDCCPIFRTIVENIT